MDAEGLPTGFVDLIRQERTRVLPCVGAGLSIPAGIRDLAADLSRTASERGADVGSGDLASVVSALESIYGIEETQVLVAETVSAIPVQPTRTQKALALCPAGIVATFNYDDCLERAASAMGRQPLSLVPDTAKAFRAPGPNELIVLHLHGTASEPSSIVLPGRTTERLAANELFMRLLTYLWARHVVVYFGFSFAPTEVHLLEALDWLASELGDAEKQRLLLREFDVSQRHEELAPLLANPLFEVVPYPDTSDHRAVHQAALLLGPINEPAPDNVSAQAPEPVPFYEPAALLEVEPGADPSAVQAEALRADWGMGTDWVTVGDLLDSGRALVSAPPGMGKTQLLCVAGREPFAAERALLCPLRELPGLLDDREDPRRAFARLVAGARAFDATTPVPTRERLETSSYIILLDGLDEVPPGRRPEVIDAALSAVQRWPQHDYVVTTRPTVEAVRLIAAGFRSLRIVLSDGWGARYMARRGVPEAKLAELRERAPTASNLLSIPSYAAAVGERLVRGDELTDRPIDLLLDPVRTMASSEAQKQGKPLASYLAWLQRLAVGLELRGRNQATTGELAAPPGPEEEDAATTRERLVQAALLNDVPDRAEFPQRTVQEALCAEALLRCSDPGEAVRAVAAADLGVEEVLRGDIEHCLDLVWANATPEQRAALRDLDALRWARTIAADCTDDEAEHAFDIIWTWHQQRRVWMDWAARGQLRGAQEAVQLLAAGHPDVVRRRLQELIDATRALEPASRGNAVEVLRRLGRDENTATWLLPLLSDANDVVRREAAQASAHLGVQEALPVLHERFPGLSDELEAEAYGRALVILTSDADLVRVAELLSQHGRVWSRFGEELAQRLALPDALAVLRIGVAAPEEQLTLLQRILQQHSPETWGSEDVELLAESLIRHDMQSYEVDGNLLATIVRRHPEAALRGIRNGADVRGVSWTHLFFVEGLPDELLRTELDGPLSEAYSAILERKADRAARAEQARETERQAAPRAAERP
ncbi:MAG: SIR2 family protein, partial [Chloroflexi bacterium]|nr:SIR2 family protein [Chloroflexota bacterium]